MSERGQRLSRRGLLAGAAACATLGATADARTVTLLVGAPAGSATDRGARAFAPFLERHLPGARLAIENLHDNAGLGAAERLAAAPRDGSVLGWATTPSLPARMVDRGGGALVERLQLIGAVQKEPIVFAAPKSGPLDTLADLLARADTIGTPPAGTPPHLAALRLREVTARPFAIVPFPSTAAVRQAILAGNVPAAALALGETLADLWDDRLEGLGVTCAERVESVPDIAPLRESGVPMDLVIRRGLAAPAGIAADAADRLAGVLQAVILDPDFLAEAASVGFLIDWADSASWRAEAESQRVAITHLWSTAPWKVSNDG